MRKFLFIINPVAGKGATKKMIPIIKEVFQQYEMDIKISKYIGDATLIASENKERYTDIISVGGDGTLTEIIDGLIGYNGNLGVLPAGTGNDFARTIQLPDDTRECLKVILEGETRKVDIPKVNDHRFINVASFGIDGGIIQDTDKIKQKISGTPAYILGSLKGILGFNPYHVKIKIDEKMMERDVVLIAVGNGKYFGGGMFVTPHAEIDDGQLDIVIANKTNKVNLIRLFANLFKGTHMGDPIVEHYKCNTFSIESEQEIFINTDGNLVGKVPATITMEMEKIYIIVPKTQKNDAEK